MSKFQKSVWRIVMLAMLLAAGYGYLYLCTVAVAHVLRGMGY